jgi:hypothetical protein
LGGFRICPRNTGNDAKIEEEGLLRNSGAREARVGHPRGTPLWEVYKFTTRINIGDFEGLRFTEGLHEVYRHLHGRGPAAGLNSKGCEDAKFWQTHRSVSEEFSVPEACGAKKVVAENQGVRTWVLVNCRYLRFWGGNDLEARAWPRKRMKHAGEPKA